jgi:hypothetical protein
MAGYLSGEEGTARAPQAARHRDSERDGRRCKHACSLMGTMGSVISIMCAMSRGSKGAEEAAKARA